MKVPHHLSGWTKVGNIPIDMLNEKHQKKLINVGDSASSQTEHTYILYKKIPEVTASNERPLAMMYRRLKKSRKSDSLRIWCFEHQERCKAPENKCKFLKDGNYCKLYDKLITEEKEK